MGFQIVNPYALAALSTIGGMLFGFDVASMSAIIASPNYLQYFGHSPSGPSSSVQGGITASMAGGSWVGALVSGILSDWIGRRPAIQISCVIWIIGSIIVCASQNIGMLVVGRFINGLTVGIASAQVPVYLSELAPSKLRGRLVGAQQWAITWGILIFYYVSYGCSFITPNDGTGTASFRVPWGLQMIPGIILLFALFFMPRSPRWLAKKGRWEECLAVLAVVHGKGDVDNPFVQAEFKEIQIAIEEESKDGSGWIDLVNTPNMLNRLHIGVFTQIWSQMTGMNVMMYYITYVFEMAGLTGNINVVSSSIQYVINVVMTVPALLWVDKWGRRPTLLVGSTFMMIWLFTVAGLMAAHGHYAPAGTLPNQPDAVRWSVHGTASKGIIACSFLFVASFAPTWGPVSWIYPPELYPTRIRGKAVAVTTSANWIFNFALGYFVPPSFHNIQWRSYLIFGCFCFAMTVHVFFCFPETKGKTLEEIEEFFALGVPAWKTRGLTKESELDKIAADIARGDAAAAERHFAARRGGAAAAGGVEKQQEEKLEQA